MYRLLRTPRSLSLSSFVVYPVYSNTRNTPLYDVLRLCRRGSTVNCHEVVRRGSPCIVTHSLVHLSEVAGGGAEPRGFRVQVRCLHRSKCWFSLLVCACFGGSTQAKPVCVVVAIRWGLVSVCAIDDAVPAVLFISFFAKRALANSFVGVCPRKM